MSDSTVTCCHCTCKSKGATTAPVPKKPQRWWHWQIMSGYIYLIICIFDFIVMPVVVHADQRSTRQDLSSIAMLEDKDFALEFIKETSAETWEPVTLIGGGLFHISFGAILSGVAITHGMERRDAAKGK